MAHQTFNELSDAQLETIAGGCHGHHHNRRGGGLMGQLRGLIGALGRVGSNSNISIIIVSNSTINAPLTISVTQKIA